MSGAKINPNSTRRLIDHMKIKVHSAPHRPPANHRPDYSHPHMHAIMLKTALTPGEL